ncbi:MAG: CoA-binding protein [Acidobacteria bacterium]|nr:CoA-binding protein [Acidobacteriota bacterium]
MVSALRYSDALIAGILRRVRTIAMVGASPNWKRPSNFAMKYLQEKGYRVIPVNPRAAAAGSSILGERARASLAEVPAPVEMVDVFRGSEAALEITREAIRLRAEKGFEVVWMQLGVRSDEAAAEAEAAGLTVIMNRCPKIEYGRIWGELGWGGFDRGVISSRWPRPAKRDEGAG